MGAMPSSQRPAALNDAVLALWVPGGCTYNQPQMQKAITGAPTHCNL